MAAAQPASPHEQTGWGRLLLALVGVAAVAAGVEVGRRSVRLVDLTALGRQEEWEEPKGRSESARSATPDFAS